MKLPILMLLLVGAAAFAADEKERRKDSHEFIQRSGRDKDGAKAIWWFSFGLMPHQTRSRISRNWRARAFTTDDFPPDRQRIHDPGRRPEFERSGKREQLRARRPGYNIKAEFNDHSHDRGVMSMARGRIQTPPVRNSSSASLRCTGSTINTQPFGKLIKGQDVLEKIGDIPVTKNSMGEPSKPTKRVVIESIKIVPADSVK